MAPSKRPRDGGDDDGDDDESSAPSLCSLPHDLLVQVLRSAGLPLPALKALRLLSSGLAAAALAAMDGRAGLVLAAPPSSPRAPSLLAALPRTPYRALCPAAARLAGSGRPVEVAGCRPDATVAALDPGVRELRLAVPVGAPPPLPAHLVLPPALRRLSLPAREAARCPARLARLEELEVDGPPLSEAARLRPAYPVPMRPVASAAIGRIAGPSLVRLDVRLDGATVLGPFGVDRAASSVYGGFSEQFDFGFAARLPGLRELRVRLGPAFRTQGVEALARAPGLRVLVLAGPGAPSAPLVLGTGPRHLEVLDLAGVPRAHAPNWMWWMWAEFFGAEAPRLRVLRVPSLETSSPERAADMVALAAARAPVLEAIGLGGFAGPTPPSPPDRLPALRIEKV